MDVIFCDGEGNGLWRWADKLPNCSVPWFSHLDNGHNENADLPDG